MVVTGRTAGSERVVEPEAVALRYLVGDIRESRRTLVGGDNQVGVFAVAPDHALRSDDFAFDHVVGDIQQTTDELAVTLDAGLHDDVAIAVRHALAEEPALGPGRNDDRVLDHLRLHQPEHLRAEVFAAVRPAQAAARNVAATQVYTLDVRREDEDLVLRPRQRCFRQFRGVQLDRNATPVAVEVSRQVEIAAQGCADRPGKCVEDTIFVDVLCLAQVPRSRATACGGCW